MAASILANSWLATAGTLSGRNSCGASRGSSADLLRTGNVLSSWEAMWQAVALCMSPLPLSNTVREDQPLSWGQRMVTWRGSGKWYAHFDPWSRRVGFRPEPFFRPKSTRLGLVVTMHCRNTTSWIPANSTAAHREVTQHLVQDVRSLRISHSVWR